MKNHDDRARAILAVGLMGLYAYFFHGEGVWIGILSSVLVLVMSNEWTNKAVSIWQIL